MLTGTQQSETYLTASAKIVATVNNDTGAASNVTATNQAAGAFTLAYNATNDSYTVNDGTASKTFTQSNTDGSDSAFEYYNQTSGSTSDELSLFTPGSSNTKLALTYVTYGIWTTATQGSSTTAFTSRFFTGGVQTAASSMPTTGTATYNGVGDGAAAIGGQSYRINGTTGSLTANFASGTTSTTLTLRGNPDVTSDAVGTTALGTLSGSGSIASGTNSYSGTISGGGTSGTFNGAFYGPGAAETGFSFATSGGGNAISGVFVGKK